MALTINLNDTGGAGESTAARAAFQAAADLWTLLLDDNAVLTLNVGFTSFSDPNILGSTGHSSVVVSYSAFKAALTADASTASDSAAVAHLPSGSSLGYWSFDANGNLIWDNDGSTNNSFLDIPTAEAKALGITRDANNNLINPSADASITFNSAFSWDFNPDNGIDAGQQDFVGVAFHEIGHALGFVSGVDVVDFYTGDGPGGPLNLNPYAIFTGLDVFRYSSAGTLNFAPAANSYFSIDGGATDLGRFSTGDYQGDGRQASHWKDNLNLGILDPTARPSGQINQVTSLDLQAFDVIGWDATVTRIVQGDQYANTLNGSGASDFVQGRDGNDVLNGGGGDDILVGGKGDDTIDGGAGRDVAQFSGNRSAYTLHTTGNTISAIGPDGQDTLTAVEELHFADAIQEVTFQAPNASNDFNGDGTSDILWRNSTTGAVATWLIDDGRRSSTSSLGNPSLDWSIAGTGDFNGDGTSDVLWRNSTTGEVGSWLMTNGQYSSFCSIARVSSDWSIAGTGDFNGDGTSDILWRNGATRQFGAWLMTNNRYTNFSSIGTTAPDWGVAGTGDFNGDGTSDILWRNGTTGEAGSWLMGSGQPASISSIGRPSLAWGMAGIGDFNGDGTSDILWRNGTTGEVGSWLMTDNRYATFSPIGKPSLAWDVAGIGDFNGDGTSDILWRNSSTGEAGSWLMTNNRYTNFSSIGTSTSGWGIVTA